MCRDVNVECAFVNGSGLIKRPSTLVVEGLEVLLCNLSLKLQEAAYN